ncbi:MAG TPA: helix-turn-helix domain-containing protein [bacterium]|nr:helix-turn-helix domain-containing protein [bacterium]
MSPRAYSMEKRGAAVAATRDRILEAARRVLAQDLDTELGMDAIARRADVSRLTIYYHFGSRPGLLEALFDYLRIRGNMQRIEEVVHERDSLVALGKLIHKLVGFWSSDPGVIRRLRAMAALDPEIAKGMRARDERRRRAVREIVRRAAAARKKEPGQNLAADVLFAVISFETYDALARAGHSRETIIATITRLARCAVGSER